MKPTYEELSEQNEKLLEENAKLRALVQQLMDRVAHLEAQLKQNSKNSSKPPSSDQKPNLLPKNKKEKRPYHPGASRQLLPESAVTSREIRTVESCPRCNSPMEPTGKIFKWQQVELPEIKPLVHQIELHDCRCLNCNHVDRPELEPHEQFLLGPRMEALINLCLGQFRYGHRSVREFVAILLPDLQLSQGLISKVKARAARALDSASQQIINVILSHSQPIHVDATGWRHLGRNEHVIVMRTNNLVSFACVPRQNGETLSKLFQGQEVTHLVTDRGLAVSKIANRIHQYCLSHLLRNIQGLAEHPSTTLEETEVLGEVHETIQELFHDKHRLDRKEIAESTWRQYGYVKWNYIREILEDLLDDHPSPKVARACKRILKEWDHFMVYLRSRDHPMTNNPAEESLRNLVIARKLCFGSRSSYGRTWRASIQSCIETLRRNGQSILDFLTQAIQAFRLGNPCPNII